MKLRTRLRTRLMVLGILWATASAAGAAHPASPPSPASPAGGESVQAERGSESETEPHPIISQDGHWAGALWVIIGGMFLAAAVIGPVVRANTPEEVPPAHAHDEPPGSSHHHGSSGTRVIDPHD